MTCLSDHLSYGGSYTELFKHIKKTALNKKDCYLILPCLV